MRAVVLTVDQRSSRRTPDAVPEMVGLLSDVPTALAFARTAGDEFQGVLDAPEAVASALAALLRDGRWHVGVGLGTVETPLPSTAPEARGTAFLAAREAVAAARTAPWHVRVVGDSAVADPLEGALTLWAATLDRRSAKGWEVADLLAQGLSHERSGEALGISQSAVTQRARAAGVVESRRAHALVTTLTRWFLEDADVR